MFIEAVLIIASKQAVTWMLSVNEKLSKLCSKGTIDMPHYAGKDTEFKRENPNGMNST